MHHKFILGLLMHSVLTYFCAEGCNTRWFILDSLLEKFPQLKPRPSPNPSLDEDYSYKYELTRIQNRMMSVALRTIVEFTISSGALEFSCSKLNTSVATNVTYHGDFLDCQKYYSCHKGEQVTKLCEPDEGFISSTSSCTPRNHVPLCISVRKRPDFNCTSTGLHPHDSDCNMFILCTKSMGYEAECNLGDFFDHSLLICLPSGEAEC